ncbi:hypothetical protein G6F22_019351 [Rhizopus arrhizus]|nr:hypothetical protein G6F22_019351 [Rhizopus arrhizus]
MHITDVHAGTLADSLQAFQGGNAVGVAPQVGHRVERCAENERIPTRIIPAGVERPWCDHYGTATICACSTSAPGHQAGAAAHAPGTDLRRSDRWRSARPGRPATVDAGQAAARAVPHRAGR